MAKPDWITTSPSSGMSGGAFNMIVAENPSSSTRSGVVTVKTISGLTQEIQVSQAGKSIDSLQASGLFCGIGLSKSVFPNAASGKVTFCVSLWCSNGSKIEAGYVTLSDTGGSSFVVEEFHFYSRKTPFSTNGVTVKSVVITCNPGDTPWITPYKRCIGSLDYNPENIAFGTADSTTKYPATFTQFSATELGFNLTTPVPISGDTTFVYKGDLEDIPLINITLLSWT